MKSPQQKRFVKIGFYLAPFAAILTFFRQPLQEYAASHPGLSPELIGLLQIAFWLSTFTFFILGVRPPKIEAPTTEENGEEPKPSES